MVRRLLEALHTEATETLPDLEISVFMTYLNHYVPGFKVNRFGYSRFSNFMRFMLTGSPLTLYAAEKNSHKIARRGTVGEKGEVLDDIQGLQFILPDSSRYNSLFDVPEGSSFTYTVTTPEKPKAEPKTPKTPKTPKDAPKATVRKPRAKKAKAAVKKTTAPKIDPNVPPIVIDEGSVRKWIKTQFELLSKNDSLSMAEARRMTTPEYSAQAFGIRTPIFKEIETRSNLDAQRSVNGKVKYWKESFKYNGKFYLVYKEWVGNLHAERFAAWLQSVQK
jgi:hypothetical protein